MNKKRSSWKRNVPKKKKQGISLSKQSFSILESYPQFKENRISINEIHWIGELQPSLLSSKYLIKITYTLNSIPKVWVISPKLTGRNNESIPHMYSKTRLCLYYPKAQEWDKSMWISKTIIPWTCLWLKYYELWRITGEWYGGGIHPTFNENKLEN
ncbi:hypothetical protein [Priestia megaterium]|uniref:hypothetical protein n=1 Tax=Priestia megaterium TaxID=1404 RepID=UPI001F214500|nr:hypothetical protein [Priestia megaterium]